MTVLVHCCNCGASLTRVRVDRNAVCPSCAKIRNAACQRAARARRAQVVARKQCLECWAALPADAARNTRYCERCAEARLRASRCAISARQRAKRHRLPNPHDTTAGGACARLRADATLNRGRCKRRCPDCGRLYCPDCMEAPCPTCGNHLSDNPLEARNVEAAA